MAGCKAKKCKCKSSRLVSSGAINSQMPCMDVCTTPLCGTPSMLSLMAPVIYDEIGVNLCTTLTFTSDISDLYPTADHVTATVSDITVTYGTTPTTVGIEAITGRPNCYLVRLINLDVEIIFRVYDCANRLLATVVESMDYLPSSPDDEFYDEDTNPSGVELEIYAPYGPAYSVTDTTATPNLNIIAEGTDNNTVRQGINLMALPKVLDFDLVANTATVGLSLFVQSLYYSAYKIPTDGRSVTPKGSLVPPEQSTCMDFVEGKLLDLCIRPLNLGYPAHEEYYKQECDDDKDCCCQLLSNTTQDNDGQMVVPNPDVNTIV